MWDLVSSIRDRGKTVFLTTHFMEEAERLCDRVAIMDRGKIVALDTPEALIDSLGIGDQVIFSVLGQLDEARLQAIAGVTAVERTGDRVVVQGQGDRLVSSVVNYLDEAGIRFRDLHTKQPTLEDVFLALTGRKVRE